VQSDLHGRRKKGGRGESGGGGFKFRKNCEAKLWRNQKEKTGGVLSVRIVRRSHSTKKGGLKRRLILLNLGGGWGLTLYISHGELGVLADPR